MFQVSDYDWYLVCASLAEEVLNLLFDLDGLKEETLLKLSATKKKKGKNKDGT